jgi:Cu2+-containing amine oxidase
MYRLPGTAHAVVQHQIHPLADSEILGAAFALLAAAAAQSGAIFQSLDLCEPSKDAVLAFVPGNPIPRSATVYFRQNKKSYKMVVNLLTGASAKPALILISDGQRGLTITDVSDFLFAFSNPAFYQVIS